MDLGVLQLLPRGRAASDREVVELALWEVDLAERHGFESVWVTEHHFSGYGSIGVPSVYAAGIAQRTRRIRIGYAVAVVPLHHPLRLAEEISWVDHLSEGRVAVGVGPGFSAFEFGGFGVPVNERLERSRAIRGAAGATDGAIDREIGEMYVLRRIFVADTDEEGLREVQEPLGWHREMTVHVHERGEAIDTVPTLADGSMIETTD